jgi:hypothetical protein
MPIITIRYATLLAVLLFGVGTWAQDSAPGGGQLMATARTTTQTIEKKAALVNPDEPDSVRGLVDEVFNLPRSFPRLPAPIESMVKDRLVQAEILFRQGEKPGIEEQDIVNTLNSLVDQFGGPPYLKTTLSQLRVLRMRLAVGEPIFMGPGVASPDARIGEPISSAMGPMQAVNLVETLIQEKITEPNFQVTPEEWEGTYLAKAKAQIAEQQAIVDAMRAEMRKTGKTTMARVTARSVSTDKRREIEQTFYPKISSLSLEQGLAVIDQLFVKLHLN